MAYNFAGKKIAIVGLARSGMAAAEVLKRRGAIVTIYDSKPPADIESAAAWAAERDIPVIASANDVRPADIAVVSPGVRNNSPIVQSIESLGIELWGEIEAAYRIAEAPILAVTGTNGKTTTVLMLADMLRQGGITTYAAGNIAAGSLAQPLIAAAEKAEPGDAIVAEISSFQLETITSFRPRVAALLNITPDHQDRQEWDDYVAAKWRIFEYQTEGDTAVISRALPRPRENMHLPSDVKYIEELAAPAWLDRLLVPGRHNRLNALAASAMASAFGVAGDAVERAAAAFKGVVHRLEFVDEIDGVTYINNSMCTNNAAFASSLEALQGSKIVLAGGVYKGGDMTPLADAVSQSSVKLLVLFGRSAPEIDGVVRARSDIETVVFDGLKEALSYAAAAAAIGDIVVLNPGCASFDQYRDFEDRGEQFKSLVYQQRKVTSR